MSFDRESPYNDLPLLPPAVDIETKAVLKAAIRANKALAELKGAGKNIPNQAVLLTVLGLQEAKFSSEIENIVTTNDDLYLAFAGEALSASDPATKEVLRYNQALWHGFDRVLHGRLLSTTLFEELVQILKQTRAGVRSLPGTRVVNAMTRDVIYTPPDGADRIRRLLLNLERFLYAEDDLDPLVKMAVAHYQFEAIHPFADGNGRTGRIVNILYMVEQALLELPVLYLSRFIIGNKGDYYRLIQEVTETGAWEPWIVYMLDAVTETATQTREKISAIRKLSTAVGEEVLTKCPRVYSLDLMNVLFAQPYTKIAFVQEACRVSRQTASSYLKELARNGFLRRIRAGREVYYINVPFFELLVK